MSANLLEATNTGLGRRTSQAPVREDFSKIKTAVPIPNLIEIQRESYNRFLQMDLLPEERESTGLQSVFKSVFPISDFRETATLDFVEYQIGNWQCKCGNLEGLRFLRTACKSCGANIKVDPLRPGVTLCHVCGTFNSVRPELCPNCGVRVGNRKFLATIFVRALGVWLRSITIHSKSTGSDRHLEDTVNNASFTDEQLILKFCVGEQVRV